MIISIIILLFPTKNQAAVSEVSVDILTNLQQVVFYVSSKGMILQEEKDHARPTWEAWINITSRRRAVFSLCFLHRTISDYYGLESFDCEVFSHMPAPAPKLLWLARDREEWESHYNHWLVDWEQKEYLHGEVANIKSGVILDSRAEKWLAETDELGILAMSPHEELPFA
jgi:hypothetical protein